jgi:hypothetical protein
MAMSTVRLTLIVVGTGAFFGLAILGWGRLAAFFSHPALTAPSRKTDRDSRTR